MSRPSEPAYFLHSAEEGCAPIPGFSRPAGECRYLLSFDYDGTLRLHGGAPEGAFFPRMRELARRGVRWGINTGRSLHKMAAELPLLPLMPDFICTCERYVYMADATGRLTPAGAHNARCFAANIALRERLLPTWQPALRELRRALPSLSWEVAADDPLSIEAADSATMDELMPHLAPFAGGDVAIQRAGRFMRLSDARFSKGSALRYVQQALGVEEPHLFLMGDGHNDIDAFRHFAGAFCAAPCDAHPDVAAWLREHGGYLSPCPGVCEAVDFWVRKMRIEEL